MLKLSNKKSVLLLTGLCISSLAFLGGCEQMHSAFETNSDSHETVAENSQKSDHFFGIKKSNKTVAKKQNTQQQVAQQEQQLTEQELTVSENTTNKVSFQRRAVEKGKATPYRPSSASYKTASGEPYDITELTAAHDTLPLNSYVRVTNLENGKEAIVKINDRGPIEGDSVLGLSYAAAYKLGIKSKSQAPVEIYGMSDPVRPSKYQTRQVAKTTTQKPATSLKTEPVDNSRNEEPTTFDSQARTTLQKPDLKAETRARTTRAATLSAENANLVASTAAAKPDLKTAPRAQATQASKTLSTIKPDLKTTATATPSQSTTNNTVADTFGTNSSIYLQLGSFRNKENAERLLKQAANVARTTDANLNIYEVQMNSKPMYKVRFGPVANMEQAKKLEKQIAEENLESLTFVN